MIAKKEAEITKMRADIDKFKIVEEAMKNDSVNVTSKLDGLQKSVDN